MWAPRGEAPAGPDHQVFYDGKRILVDGHAPAWVLNEQAVPVFIRNDFRELSQDDAQLAVAQLKQYSAECGKEAP